MREVAKPLNVETSEEFFLDAKLSIGGRVRKMISTIERSCMIKLSKRKVGTTSEATKHVQEVYGVQVSDLTICHAFY